MLKELAEKQRQEKENRQKSSENVGNVDKRKNEENPAKDSTSKKMKKEDSKEDIFDAHNFDIEIDVDATLANGASSANPTNQVSANAAVKPAASITPKNTGPAKRSLNLSDYKKKRGLIWVNQKR